jgi:MSHA biogenesis protein MshL
MKRIPLVLCLSALALSLSQPSEAAKKKHRAAKPDYTALMAADQAAADFSQQPQDSTQAAQQPTDYDQFPATAAGVMSTSLANPVPKAVVVSGSARDLDARFELAVNNAQAAQVFLQLGVGTGYSILVSPEVSGLVTVGLKNTTVPEALEVMRELFGYDYRLSGNRVFVYPNTVQTRIYRINYLPGRRQGMSELRVSSSAITGGGGTGSGQTASSGGSNGREDMTDVKTTSDTDFWKEVRESLVSMVGTVGGRSVVMNPGAGVVVIRATPAEHRHVTDFLKAVQINIERQVMLEAKIIEVQLTNASQTGVNWAVFGSKGKGSAIAGSVAPGTSIAGTGSITTSDSTVSTSGSVDASLLGRGFYGLAVQTTNFAALISFLQTQGDVQVLSSPRIATMNNQKAVLKVGSDEFFVTGIKTETTTAGTSSVTTPSLTFQPFFSGISLDVTAQIDDTGTVMMHIHPSVSTVSEKQKVLNLGSAGSFKFPLASSAINETDSIVKVKDGHIVAIGGLMRIETSADKSGVPGLSDVPGVGGLFRQKDVYTNKRELVVLIRPTVIGEDGSGWVSSEPTASMISPMRQ